MRTDLHRQMQVMAEEIFGKKLEDLDEHEVREAWEIHALLAAVGRAAPRPHARLASWGGHRRTAVST